MSDARRQSPTSQRKKPRAPRPQPVPPSALPAGNLTTSSLRVTARDVARAAGVSQATVSLALRGSPEVSEQRAAQIRVLASNMGYHPRAAAQLLRSKRAGQIGVLVAATDAVSAFSLGFTGPLLGSLVDSCAHEQVRYMIEFHSHEQNTTSLPYQVTSGLVDGSIIIGDVGETLRQQLRTEYPRFPWVSIDEAAPYCVLSDSRIGISQVVEMLYRLGHRRLAYAGGPQRYFTHREGFLGWEETTRRLGLAIPASRQLVFSGQMGSDAAETYAWAGELLRQPDRPTAFVCHGMALARSVVHVAVQSGLSIPRDLSVTSWGWHVTAHEQYPPLSTVELNYREMTQQSLAMLSRLIAGEPLERTRMMVPPRYVEGSTVAPPPGS